MESHGDSPEPIEPRGMTWEEMTVGLRLRTAKRTISEADLVHFVSLAGFNEPLFIDRTASQEAGYDGRLVPGALTYSIAEGLVIQTHVIHGTGVAFVHMELDVLRPVYVGDTIHCEVEITESRPTSGDRGVVTSRNVVINQDGEEVLVYTPVRIIKGRSNASIRRQSGP